MLKNKEVQNENQTKDAIVAKIYDINDIDVPKSLVEEEIDQMAQELDQQLRYQGMSLQQYCQFTGKDIQGFRDDVRDDAERRAGTRIALLSVAAAENLEVTEEEIDKELESMSSMYNMGKEEISKMLEASMKLFKKDLLVKKTIDMLYDEAKVTRVDELTAEKKEEAEDTEEK